MKIAFSRSVTFTPTWKGNDKSEDPFCAILKPTDLITLITLVDAFQAAGLTGKVDTETVSVEQMRRITEAVGFALPKFVLIENLEGQDGEITIDDVVRDGYFLKLALELLAKLAEVSSPSDEDEGN